MRPRRPPRMRSRRRHRKKRKARIREFVRRRTAAVRTDEELLTEILEAAHELEILVSRGRARYGADFEPRRTAERLVEIIGEAAGQLSAELRERRPDLPLREAKAARNFLAHDYMSVDYGELWRIASTDVPALASELKSELEFLTAEQQASLPPRPASTHDPVSQPPSTKHSLPVRPEMPKTPVCGITTSSGQPCRHPLPPPGESCPDGHRHL